MKCSDTLVSILIINYNNTVLLERSINSCLQQSYKNIEILVYDDNSDQPIIPIIKKFKKIKNIRFFKNKNLKKKIAAFDAANAYEYLINKCNGEIISLLDSDDFISKNKIKELMKIFVKNNKIKFVQNLHSSNLINNSLISFWPYFAPESCLSFRKEFSHEFFKTTKKIKYFYPDIWLGFRMCVFSYFKKKNFYQINKKLTFYENYGESLKYKKFGKKWWIRRKNSFEYLFKILDKKFLFFNVDYLITLFVNIIIKFFYEKKLN